MILGIALGGILPAAWDVIRAGVDRRAEIRARALATEIYEEIFSLPREKSKPPQPHPKPITRSEYRSVRDYDALEESPPKDPLGEPLADCEGFTRRVRLRYLDPADIQSETPASEALLAEITVEISRNGESIEKLTFLRSLQ